MNLPFRIPSLLIIAVLTVSASACSPSYDGKNQPLARNGVLDVRNWDFDRDGPVSLSGEWLLYQNEILKPENCNDEGCGRTSGITMLPAGRSRHSVAGQVLTASGSATYRLTVLLNERYDRRILAIKISEMRSAKRFYVNNSLVSSTGVVAGNEKDERFGTSVAVKSFVPGASRLSILMAISNHTYSYEGPENPVLLGTEEQITGIMKGTVSKDLFIFGSLMMIFLFYLNMYILRRTEKSFLYFSLYCLAVGIFGMTTGDTNILVFFPSLTAEQIYFLIHASFYCSIPVFLRFLFWLFPGVIPLTFARIVDPLPLLFLAVEALLPYRLYATTGYIYQLLSVAVVAVTIFFLVRALLKGYKGMRVFLSGFVILIAAFINDLLFYNKVIITGYFITQGLMLFIIFQSLILSYRFTRAYAMVETLHGELAALNEDLAEKVKERTEELDAALTEMGSMNETLASANKSLEEAGRIAERDMRMATYVQNAIIFKEPPQTGEWDVACSYRPMAGVSGDFYDFYTLGGSLAGIAIFDVSGHGISSGLVTMIAKTLLFRLFRDYHDSEFNSIFNRFNQDLYYDIGRAHYYLTGLLLKLEGNAVHFLNAGHHDMLLRDAGGVKPASCSEPDGRSGFILGVKLEDYTCDMTSITLQEGDVLALFTDGMVEARNEDEELFDVSRISKALAEAPGSSSREILDHILERFNEFTGNTAIRDDITVIIMRRR